MKKRRTRKKFFLLLEVTLACTLAALCLVPLIKPHFAIRQAHYAELEKTICEREAFNAFMETKQLLYEHQIPWGALAKGTEGDLPQLEVSRGPGFHKIYDRCYTLNKKRLYTHNNTHFRYLLMDCTIHFSSKGKTLYSFTFPLFIESKHDALS